jgi:hypothetical protein
MRRGVRRSIDVLNLWRDVVIARRDAFSARSRRGRRRGARRDARDDARGGSRGRADARTRRKRVATVRLSVMGSDYARRVRRARALARDPTTARDALRAFCASDASAVGAVATLATAGASGCGKTALVRRFFAESRRRRGCANADASEDWRATRTIGMDFGVMSCALERSDGDEDGGEARAPARARGRFFDPSGAAAHAACRAAAYRRADGVVYVLDQTLGDVDARAIERGLREIVDARRGETRGVVRGLVATESTPRRPSTVARESRDRRRETIHSRCCATSKPRARRC